MKTNHLLNDIGGGLGAAIPRHGNGIQVQLQPAVVTAFQGIGSSKLSLMKGSCCAFARPRITLFRNWRHGKCINPMDLSFV